MSNIRKFLAALAGFAGSGLVTVGTGAPWWVPLAIQAVAVAGVYTVPNTPK